MRRSCRRSTLMRFRVRKRSWMPLREWQRFMRFYAVLCGTVGKPFRTGSYVYSGRIAGT